MKKSFLIVPRKEKESVIFMLPTGEEIFVRVHEVSGKWTKLAISAPDHVEIIKVKGTEPYDNQGAARVYGRSRRKE